MKNTRTARTSTALLGTAIALSFLGAANVYAVKPDWNYDNCNDANPSCGWHLLSDNFYMCGGDHPSLRQSPIDVTPNSEQLANDLESIDYTTNSVVVVNDDNGIAVRHAEPGENLGSIRVDGQLFFLRQIQFHTPSEHTLFGQRFPMEIQFTHIFKSVEGAAPVVFSVFASDDAGDDPALDKILDHAVSNGAPIPPGNRSASFKLNPADLLPGSQQHMKYLGSYTTPPCGQPVDWRVFQHRVQTSSQQLDEFEAIMGQNNRPLQEPKGRSIYLVP